MFLSKQRNNLLLQDFELTSVKLKLHCRYISPGQRNYTPVPRLYCSVEVVSNHSNSVSIALKNLSTEVLFVKKRFSTDVQAKELSIFKQPLKLTTLKSTNCIIINGFCQRFSVSLLQQNKSGKFNNLIFDFLNLLL